MNLIQLLQEILGNISSYKSRYEQTVKERNNLEAEINQAELIAQAIKEALNDFTLST